MEYPKYIEVEDQRFELDTDYRTALKCFEVIEDPDIDDIERSLAVIVLLLNDIPQVDLNKVMELLMRYLSCGKSKDSATGVQKDMDLHADENYIIASFASDYKIDLSSVESMHWWHFITLLDGLSGDCVLNRVREIRTCDLKDYRGKARERMAKAKAQLALPTKLTAEHQKALDKFDALFLSSENRLDDGDTLLDGGE